MTAIRVTEIAGSASERGAAHGTAHAAGIRAFCDERFRLVEAANGWDRERQLALAEEMLPAHADYDPELYEEMCALGAAAGLSPAEAMVVGGYTDFLDTVRARAGSAPVEDNCTAVIVPDALADGAGFLAQTWDMDATATPFVIMLDVAPDTGPGALVFTTMGTLGQIGMNEAGIAIGINNLTASDGTVGVTWPFVVRKVLRQTNFDDAVACVMDAKLAGGHNFLIADAGGRSISIEAMPSRVWTQAADDRIVAHTNHCLVPETVEVEGDRPDYLVASSTVRLEQAVELLAARPVTVEHLMAMTRDERSICRHPTPPGYYESCGGAIMRPATREFWACWGIPSENEYERFEVSR